MPQPRQLHFLALITTFVVLFSANFLLGTVAHADEPRIAVAYTAWDSYFFYAAFEVNDHNVISVNRTPVSNPQHDDDVEVFINTNPSVATTVRAPDTYQMAVSAGSGSYFSVGDGTKIPKPKLVLTYKYAVTVDGTLNNPDDNDTGYTVELAIPWQELGFTGPPAAGQTWGFNVISRNREQVDAVAQTFVSLSPAVQTRDDVQNPSKWTKIQFISTLAHQVSTPALVYCPQLTSDSNYPVIDGVISSGEWNESYGISFGKTLVAGIAPSKDEEPNITNSPFASLLQPVVQTPQTQVLPPSAPTPTNQATPDYTLSLPGGGEIHVGKLRQPPPQPIIPDIDDNGHLRLPKYSGNAADPLAPDLPPAEEVENEVGPQLDPDASLSLMQQKDLSPLIVAPYTFAYPSTINPVSLIDQPIEGFGPEFGGNHAQWHESQLADARRAGIDVLLAVIDPGDPQSTTGLAALVESMKELNANGDDYPLLGVKVKGNDPVASMNEFLKIVPKQFRAEVILPDQESDRPAYIAVVDTQAQAAELNKAFTDNKGYDDVLATTLAGTGFLKIGVVTPGGDNGTGQITGRLETKTLTDSWSAVISSNPEWVYVDSWNDFEHGTEVAGSREYGEQYVDQTRTSSLLWSGADQWDAKYLSNDVPNIIAQRTIYTVSIRVENNGSLPWRSGEQYALSYRWYKDGRLYDDSAPKLPLNDDIYPGQSTTVKVGVVAQNSSGGDIEPGLYTLVFDIVQGDDRWFSYAGSRPLRIPVRIEDPADAPQSLPVVLSSTTPAILDPNGTYTVALSIRNEGQETWDKSNTSISLDGNPLAGSGTFDHSVYAGAIGLATISIKVPVDQPVGRIGTLVWNIKTPGSTVTWTEHPLIVAHDMGPSFGINDVPRAVTTSSTIQAKVTLINGGPYSWTKSNWKVGYEWLYLDGTPATTEQTAGPLDSDTDVGIGVASSVVVKTPDFPGKYQLVFDLIGPDGTHSASEDVTSGLAILPLIVSVEPGKDASAWPLDLSKYFNGNGEGFQSPTDPSDFDGNGNTFPAVYMPPDGTQEPVVTPFSIGKPAPAEYPSGYYASSLGSGVQSNHRIGFLYGPKNGNNYITASGQSIDLPAGKWSTVHILAASIGTAKEESATFTLSYDDGTVPVSIAIANWTKVPSPSVGTVALRFPYYLSKGTVTSGQPVFIGDYALPVDNSRRLTKLILPTDPSVKVLAVTLER